MAGNIAVGLAAYTSLAGMLLLLLLWCPGNAPQAHARRASASKKHRFKIEVAGRTVVMTNSMTNSYQSYQCAVQLVQD